MQTNRFYYLTAFCGLLLFIAGCVPLPPASEMNAESSTSSNSDPNIVNITLIHMNDVYEMNPVANGTQGGVARVATVRNRLLEKNPNTITTLGGDLFSPSALGTAKVDGEELAGAQMVAVMNAMGLDYATFGNHEFDIDEDQFLQRLSESETTWFSSNVFDVNGEPFPDVVQNIIVTVSNAAGESIQVGMFGLTLGSNAAEWVTYRDPMEVAGEQIAELQDQVDILIAMTHLSVQQDTELVEAYPEIDLVLGGHEHEDYQLWRGPSLTPIIKADGNARTVYVLELAYNIATEKLELMTKLQLINEDIPDDPAVAQVAAEWQDKAFAGYREQGFDAEATVTVLTEPLDGTEVSVRNTSTRLTELIAAGMLPVVADAEVAIFNGGSIRIDDTLLPGPLSQYDVIRTMPFGGIVNGTEIKGSLLQDVLDQGQANKGSGGYLQTANVDFDPGTGDWSINGEPLDRKRTYIVAINDFLLTGFETGLDFLTIDNPDLTLIEDVPEVDIRQSFMGELQRVYGPPPTESNAASDTGNSPAEESELMVDLAALQEEFRAAVVDAEDAEANEIVDTLTAITPENENLIRNPETGQVLVVTWTSWDGYDDLVGQEMALAREIWVTAAPELQTFCQTYTEAETPLTLRLEQLMGLPPEDGKNRFVEVWANPEDLFRPSPDPEIDDTTAGLEMESPENFPSQEYYDSFNDWYNLQLSFSYDEENGYPWTRLGYTYDWHSPDDEVGLSEFVIWAGSTISVEQVHMGETYCDK